MTDSYMALDLETTGLSPENDQILEIGALWIENGEAADSYETFVACRIPIPPVITQLTGITDEMVEGSPCMEEALRGFLDFESAHGGMISDPPVLLGHNLPFDYSFMKHSAVQLGLSFERKGLDTLKIARTCLPNLEKKSLDQTAAYLGIPQKRRHRALNDALTASRIYERLKSGFEEQYPELFEPRPMLCRVRRVSPITNSQKAYLRELIKCHRIESDVKIETLTKSEASRMISGIISQYGRLKR